MVFPLSKIKELFVRVSKSGHAAIKPHPKHKLVELGLTQYLGGLQATIGYFSTHTTHTTTATCILELLKAALDDQQIKVDFRQKDTKGKKDFYVLEACVNECIVPIAVRIDQENYNANCNGFIPEEKEGGFGILLRVRIEDHYDEFCREIYNSGHIADPDCDLEIAVAEIKKIIDALK